MMNDTTGREPDVGDASPSPSHLPSYLPSPLPWPRRMLLRGEAAIDGAVARLRGTRHEGTIVPHAGYAHANGVECFARVLERPSAWMPKADDGRWANLRGVGSMFATYEVPGAPVRIEGPRGPRVALADEEGYVRASLPPFPAPPERTRWTELPARIGDSQAVAMPILEVGASSRFAVLSDIDDTVMETGAENVARNLWTTFTGNPLTRHVYARVPELYRGLHAHADGTVNPIFYLSSSPWNLYRMIREVLARESVPWGPIFLRDYGLDETKFIKSTHGDHKLANARAVMDHLDGLPFVLIGDLGQADTEIYAALARERTTQVAGVVIHRPSGREHADKLRHVEAIDALGIPVVVTTDYGEAERLARERGWIDRA